MEKTTDQIIKIAILGPESSGKSTLTEELAQHFSEPWVNENARSYLEQRKGVYQKEDLDFMLEEQYKLEQKQEYKAKKFLFCDTNLLSFKIWSLYKYGDCSDFILKRVKDSFYDFHLLLSPDLGHENDPLRENPDLKDRKELFEFHRKELLQSQQQFAVIQGFEKKRFENALKAIQSRFSL